MKKFLRLFALFTLCLCLSLCIFTACDNTPQEEGFTLSFSGGDGAEGTMEALTLKEGEEVQLPSNAFTKSGYAFIGWSDGATLYDVGDTFKMPAKDVTMTAEWQVTEKTVTTITQVSDVSKTYDGQPAAAPTFKTNSDATAQIEWYKGDTKLQSAPADAGDYSVLITLPETELYTTCKELKTFTISKADIPFTATGWADKADGQEHKITVATEVEGATITYSTQEDGEYTAENPGFSAKGKYDVFFKITAGPNYNEASGKALVNIMINVASSRIEIQNPQGYTYDAEEQDVQVKVFYTEEGQPEKEYQGNFDIEFAVKEGGRLGENQKPLGAGKYTVKVTVDAADEGELAGYAIDDEEELTVNKATLTVNATDTVKVFAVEDYELECEYVGFKGNDDESVITGTATANIDGLSNTTTAGVHTGTVNVEGLSAADYDIQAGTCTVTVEKEDLIIEELGAVVTVDGQPYTVTTQGIIDYNSQVSVDYARGYVADDSGDFDITGVQIESAHSGKAIGPVTVCANAKLRVYTITYGGLEIAGAKESYTVEDEEFQLPVYTESTTGFFKGWKHNGETITSVNPQDLEFELEDLDLTADLVDVVGANLFAEAEWNFLDQRNSRWANSAAGNGWVSGNIDSLKTLNWSELKQSDGWVVDNIVDSMFNTNTNVKYGLVEPRLEVTKFVNHIQETAHSVKIKLKVEVTGSVASATDDKNMSFSLRWGDTNMGQSSNGNYDKASNITYAPTRGTVGEFEFSLPLPTITDFKDSESYWLVLGVDIKKGYEKIKITFEEFSLSTETVKSFDEELFIDSTWTKGGLNGSAWTLNGADPLAGINGNNFACNYAQSNRRTVLMPAEMIESYSQNVSPEEVAQFAFYNEYDKTNYAANNRFDTYTDDIEAIKDKTGYLEFGMLFNLLDASVSNVKDRLTICIYFGNNRAPGDGTIDRRSEVSYTTFEVSQLQENEFTKIRLPIPKPYNNGGDKQYTVEDYKYFFITVVTGNASANQNMIRFELYLAGFKVVEQDNTAFDISEYPHRNDGKNGGSVGGQAGSFSKLGKGTLLSDDLAQKYNTAFDGEYDGWVYKFTPDMSQIGAKSYQNSSFEAKFLSYLGSTFKLKIRFYVEVTGGNPDPGKVGVMMFVRGGSNNDGSSGYANDKIQKFDVNQWGEATFDVDTTLPAETVWQYLTMTFVFDEYASNKEAAVNVYVESIMLVSEAV